MHRPKSCLAPAVLYTVVTLASAGPIVAAENDQTEGALYPHSTTRPSATQPATEPTTRPVPGNLYFTTWAASGHLKNPVALTFDRAGRCYVAQTQRRDGGELQVRTDPVHRVVPDHSFFSVDDRFRWAGDGDADWGTQTGGKKEIITLFEDSRGTGKADVAKTFYEGWDQNGNDILAGILWHEGNIYATLAPNLWMLRDTKNADHADQVKSLSFGYGVHMSYSGHNMHGLTVGPDGKIYFTIGDKGLNVMQNGTRLDYPYCGSVIRCNADGTELEVFAYGLRNPQEIAFDKFGNLFAVDNDGDFPTERERLVYITEGSDSGWRYNWQYRSKAFDVTNEPKDRKERYNVWMKERLWVPHFPQQAAYITPALANYTDGPCGFKYATEACLNDKFAGSFFVDEFPKATIRSFRVKPKGAYFAMYDDQIVSRGVQCTGLAFGPDGALYGAEWGKSGFKLGNTGSVVKLDDSFAAGRSLRTETRKLLVANPKERDTPTLITLLGHVDMRVRLDAQFELARRGDFASLAAVLKDNASPQMALIHAIWGIVQTERMQRLVPNDISRIVVGYLSNADEELRAQAVKAIGDLAAVGFKMTSPQSVEPLLSDPSPRVRFFAAKAFGILKPKNVDSLFKLAETNHPVDPFIRHAAVLGLVQADNSDSLMQMLNPSMEVRLTAVVALRRLKDPRVARFLLDRDELVAAEAARAIHDDYSIPQALPELAKAVERSGMTDEAFIRRALNANLRVGGAEQVERLVRYSTDETRPSAMRVEALDILANWEHPAVNDRVEGWYRTWPLRSSFAVKAALNTQMAGLLGSQDHDVALAATQLIEKLGLKTNDAVFVNWVADTTRPAAARVTALGLLASRKFPDLGKSIDVALQSTEPLLRIEAARLLTEHEPQRALQLISHMINSGTTVEKQAGFRLLGEIKSVESMNDLSEWMGRFQAGEVAAEVQLDLLQAAESTRNKQLRARVRAWEDSLPPTDPLARLYPALQGGDAERGKAIFTGHPEAACIRCHSTSNDGTGSTVGPSLAGIGAKADKPRRYLLESMVDPNAYIVPGYGMSSFKLKDGSEVAAFVRSENETTVQLFDLEGKASELKKADIVSRTPGVSMMPAMGAILNREEIRDVIEYLSSLK